MGKEVTANLMNPAAGFLAVLIACCTSGLAGVYFEMVLKNTQTDLWIRNTQLSLFSLIPAALPIIYELSKSGHRLDLFHNFGGWAWSTVFIQVFGGLITSLVIKYADNILKGFATSLSIVISCLASVALFNFPLTFTFAVGASVVLAATWMYSQSGDVIHEGAAECRLTEACQERGCNHSPREGYVFVIFCLRDSHFRWFS